MKSKGGIVPDRGEFICRLFGHQWVYKHHKHGRYYTLDCKRCGKRKGRSSMVINDMRFIQLKINFRYSKKYLIRFAIMRVLLKWAALVSKASVSLEICEVKR